MGEDIFAGSLAKNKLVHGQERERLGVSGSDSADTVGMLGNIKSVATLGRTDGYIVGPPDADLPADSGIENPFR